MIIDKHINKDNWYEIKDILPQITVIASLELWNMGLTEFPKMSHITINGNFYCCCNKITSFKDCPPIINGNFNCSLNKIASFKDCPPIINGDFYCYTNPLTSFKDCPIVKGTFWGNISAFNKIYKYSKEKKISLLDAQVELYNKQDDEILAHIDMFPDLVAYIRLKELNKLLWL